MTDPTTLSVLSSTLESVVAATRPSIVSVHSRRSRATGFVWKAGFAITADEALADEGEIAILFPDEVGQELRSSDLVTAIGGRRRMGCRNGAQSCLNEV